MDNFDAAQYYRDSKHAAYRDSVATVRSYIARLQSAQEITVDDMETARAIVQSVETNVRSMTNRDSSRHRQSSRHGEPTRRRRESSRHRETSRHRDSRPRSHRRTVSTSNRLPSVSSSSDSDVTYRREWSYRRERRRRNDPPTAHYVSRHRSHSRNDQIIDYHASWTSAARPTIPCSSFGQVSCLAVKTSSPSSRGWVVHVPRCHWPSYQ